MSIVWIIAEPRTGSTSFSKKVAEHLGRQYFFADQPNQVEEALAIQDPKNYVLYTHSFNVLERMNVYTDPVLLIRCTRKDKAEQCLSHLCTGWINRRLTEGDQFWNIESEDDFDSKLKILNSIEPTVFTKHQVFNYLDHCASKEKLWNSIVTRYDNHTIFYEDLCSAGIDIPAINLQYKLQDGSATIKFPLYKERLCLNHQMVRKWVDEYYAQVVELVDTQR